MSRMSFLLRLLGRKENQPEIREVHFLFPRGTSRRLLDRTFNLAVATLAPRGTRLISAEYDDVEKPIFHFVCLRGREEETRRELEDLLNRALYL